MKRALSLIVPIVIAWGCSSSTSSTPASGTDPANPNPTSTSTSTAPTSTGTTPPPEQVRDGGTDSGVDSGVCAEPAGATCPTTAGNCKGIGKPCTKGGGECNPGTSCDKDLDPSGVGICVSYLQCTPGKKDCGAGASCCQTSDTENVPVCMPNQCRVDGCAVE